MENGGAGVLGSAVIDGRATDVIDTGWWLTRAWPDWFAAGADTRAERVLVVEDSAFFRQLVTPVLAAAGYRVTGAASAAEALALRDAGARFEAILSDIDMPCMDGLDFVRALRGGGAWRDLPVIALAGAADPDTVQAAREAGFTDFVAKFERGALLGSLRQCLDQKTEA